MKQTIAERIACLRQSIEETARGVSRPPESVQFLLASKTVSDETILEACRAGVLDFGENRMQEFLDKKKKLPDSIRWHYIGRLQTNKVKNLLACAPVLPLLHSLDREELADEIQRQARRTGVEKVPCLIQVNTSGEASKAGFAPDQVNPFLMSLTRDSPLWIRGLMTIGPLTGDRDRIRSAFRRLRMIQQELREKFPEKDWAVLSMGMSSDYDIAIEEGATMLRIGSAVFGPRGIDSEESGGLLKEKE